jgi:hypothetical protein
MALYASWTHGTGLTVESPENLTRISYRGSGAYVFLKPGTSSWFHISIPTPVIVNTVRAHLERVFLLFDAQGGSITNVHVYDGSSKVQQFDGLHLQGNHLGLDAEDTFKLSAQHTVLFGIGISFVFAAAIPSSRLVLGTAGADFAI